MLKKVLKLNGKPLDLHPVSASVLRVRVFLDKQSGEDLFTIDELCRSARVCSAIVRADKNDLVGYQHKLGKLRYWGNPKAIAELKRIADED